MAFSFVFKITFLTANTPGRFIQLSLTILCYRAWNVLGKQAFFDNLSHLEILRRWFLKRNDHLQEQFPQKKERLKCLW